MDIALCQLDIAWAEPETNRRRVEAEIDSLPAATDIYVVPETFTTGFGDHMASLAEQPEGPTLQWARQMAARHDLLFVGTWIVREGDRCFNRLHWIRPDGTFGHYDKAHTFRVSGEHDMIARGTEKAVFEYKGWRIRPAVCYDLRFPKWLRNDNMEYDLLLVCANWPASRREAWSTLLKARAIENICYVVGCNRTGVDANGGEYSGDSAIINYKGHPLDGIAASLSLDKLQTFRQKWPFFLDFD